MYSAENILWIKNVLRNQGAEWAYDNVSCNSTFLLNWSTAKRGSAATPGIGDIIVLFQKVKKIDGRKNYDVHFTHLVSPVSNDIIEDPNSPNHKWCREVRLIAMPAPLNAIPNPGYFNFFLPNRGLTNPIVNLQNNIDLSEAETKDSVWSLFEDHICPNVRQEIFTPPDPVGIFGEREGDPIIREHIRQEIARRNSSIVQQAKAQAKRAGNGRIFCECCNFDFLQEYGPIGEGFIECHHKIPIAQGVRDTTIADLALVCSNCHRMLHRRKEDHSYYDVDQLRVEIARLRQSRLIPL